VACHPRRAERLQAARQANLADLVLAGRSEAPDPAGSGAIAAPAAAWQNLAAAAMPCSRDLAR
jgi:hypothetical protein